MATLLDELNNWLRTLFLGNMPCIHKSHCVKGKITSGLKSAITKNVEWIINHKDNKPKNYKFGKTGFPPNRADQYDYRLASYSDMYLLYESTSVSNVEELEKYYCNKYKVNKRNDNVDVNSLGKMKSMNGKYYLYFVL